MVFLRYPCLDSDTKVLFLPVYLYFQYQSFASQKFSCVLWGLCGWSWLQPSSLLGSNQTSYFWSFGTETDCILFFLASWNFVSNIIQLLACLFVESFILASGRLFVRQRDSFPCPLIFVISRLAKRCDSAEDQGTKYVSRNPWCFLTTCSWIPRLLCPRLAPIFDAARITLLIYLSNDGHNMPYRIRSFY